MYENYFQDLNWVRSNNCLSYFKYYYLSFIYRVWKTLI